ncbi:MAG: protein phosphatase 2C domain-containing protein [bacterium]
MDKRSTALQAAGLSDQGLRGDSNQDAFFVDTERGLFLVADGMGGHRAGTAAALAVAKGFPLLLDRHLGATPGRIAVPLRNAILELNASVRAEGQRNERTRGMGSTLTCLFVHGRMAHIANLGDSRVYRWRNGLQCLTQDHSLTALLLREGEISRRMAAFHPGRSQLTRFIGMEQDSYPDISSVRLKIGDRFLLCTDGLWGVVPDKQIRAFLGKNAPPESICRDLIEAAKARGSNDNITAVVVFFGMRASSAPPKDDGKTVSEGRTRKRLHQPQDESMIAAHEIPGFSPQ